MFFSDEEKEGREVIESLETVLIQLGIVYHVRLSGIVVAECPFCRSQPPKLNLWPKSGRFACHNCKTSGDCVDLISQVKPLWTLKEIFGKFGETDRFRRLPVDHPEFPLLILKV